MPRNSLIDEEQYTPSAKNSLFSRAKNALLDPEFWYRDIFGKASEAAQGAAAGAIGAPVDIASSIMRPFGYKVPEDQTVGSTEWIGRMMGAPIESASFTAGSFGPIPDASDAIRMASNIDPRMVTAILGSRLRGPDASIVRSSNSVLPDAAKAANARMSSMDNLDDLAIERIVKHGTPGSGFHDYEMDVVNGRGAVSLGDNGAIRFTGAHEDSLSWAEFDNDGNLLKAGNAPFVTPTESELNSWAALAPRVARRVKSNIAAKPQVPVFIRFGEIPKSGRSRNHATGKYENGVSVYGADFDLLRGGFKYADQGTESGALISYVLNGVEPTLVTGSVAGMGSDGEPVLKGVKKLGSLKFDQDTSAFFLD